MTDVPSLPARFGVRARRLFDGRRARHGGPPALVVVEGGRITAVDVSGAEPSSDLEVLDLGDATLLPGLVDTHVHLAFDATDDAPAHVQEWSGDVLLAHMRSAARSMLDVGITTARDLGDRGYLSLLVRDDTRDRLHAGPTLLTAGPPLTPTGGHCWFLGGEADGLEELESAVRAHAEHGVDVVKVMATGGRMTPTTLPHESQYSADELRVVVDTAHALGLPVAAHAHARSGIVDALDAGVDTLEHVSFMTAEGIAPDQAVIDRIAQDGTIASLTVGGVPGVPTNPFIERVMPLIQAHVRNLAASGVRLALGPDGGIAPSKPHDVLPHSVVELVACGLSVAEALVAVTSTGAEACGLGRRVGHVAPGYDADLLAVRGDLLADVSAIHDVVAVLRRGVRVA